MADQLHSRRTFLSVAPAAALTGAAAVSLVPPISSELSRLIEAHREADRAATAATDAWCDLLEVTTEPRTFVRSYKRSYEASLGRDEILGNIARDFADAAARLRKSNLAELLSVAEVNGAIHRLEAMGAEALADAARIFDKTDNGPVGQAAARVRAASEVESAAFAALVSLPCRSLADAVTKAEYIAGTDYVQGEIGLKDEEVAALLASIAAAVRS